MDRHAWDERYASEELVWSAGPNQFLVAEVPGPAPDGGRALDVACGEGRNAIWLGEQGWQVTAADFSAVALQKGARLAAARDVDVQWVEADLTRWDPPAHGFDLVIVFYLQLDGDGRAAALTRACRAVAPGGTLLFVAHAADNLVRGVGGPQDAAVLYSPGEVVDLVATAGLTIEKADHVERTVTTPDGDRVAVDVLVRAVRPLAGADAGADAGPGAEATAAEGRQEGA